VEACPASILQTELAAHDEIIQAIVKLWLLFKPLEYKL
jgi:hypothetical protein